MTSRLSIRILVLSLALASSACASTKNAGSPLSIQDQGIFAVGGSVVQRPGAFDPIKQGGYDPNNLDSTGQSYHGDHATVFYQVPVKPKKLPLVFWHGHGQTMRTWQTTPDGREGFQTISYEPGGDFVYPEGEKVESIDLGGRVIPPIFHYPQVLPST